MLMGGSLNYLVSSKYNCQLIGFKYQKQLTSMYIIVPNHSSRTTLRSFQKSLTADQIEEMILESRERSIAMLTIPKFKIGNEINLSQTLSKLGVSALFSPAADLTGIVADQNELEPWYKPYSVQNSLDNLDRIKKSLFTRNGGLYVTEIIHKVQLTVNEVGTEGGAATSAIFDRISTELLEIKTPFLVLIRQDYTRLPLFYGPVFEP